VAKKGLWIGVSLTRLLLLFILIPASNSCTSDEPKNESLQVPSEDERTRLKKAVSGTDLNSTPDLVALNCRMLSKNLDGQPFPEDLRPKCAEAMLAMARRATLGQDPVVMRKSPTEWISEAQSFGASNESVSKAKKQIALDERKAAAEQKRQQVESRKVLREAGAASRKAMAERMRTSFLDGGLDIKVKTSGRHAERITFEYALFNDVWSHRFQKDGVLTQLVDAGFERVDMTDGYDWHVYWKF
jgi:hypothetical protein